MVTYLLKKSYQHKTLKEIKFKDLWGDNGMFLQPCGSLAISLQKFYFLKSIFRNLIKSLNAYKLKKTQY